MLVWIASPTFSWLPAMVTAIHSIGSLPKHRLMSGGYVATSAMHSRLTISPRRRMKGQYRQFIAIALMVRREVGC